MKSHRMSVWSELIVNPMRMRSEPVITQNLQLIEFIARLATGPGIEKNYNTKYQPLREKANSAKLYSVRNDIKM